MTNELDIANTKEAGMKAAFDAMAKRAPKPGKFGPSKLAKALGINKSAVSNWAQVPTSRVIEVSLLTGVAQKVLRPDLFEKPAG